MTNKFIESVEHYCDGLHVAVGAADCCDECDGSDDEGHFSWQQCDSCGSTLGGDRFAAHGIDAEKNLYHFDICVDCLFFHANGDTPDNWQRTP